MSTQTPAEAFIHDLSASAQRIVAATLGVDRSRTGAFALSDQVAAMAENAIRLVRDLHPPARAYACGMGCAHCCEIRVVATDVPTVLKIAFRTASALPMEVMGPVVAALGRGERPCAFLQSGACSIYADRPVVCRSYNGYEAANCAIGLFVVGGENSAADVGDPWPFLIGAAIQDGVAAGLTALGLDARQVTLAGAIALLAADPSRADRWLAGEPVFADAVAT